jgi:cathepsin X
MYTPQSKQKALCFPVTKMVRYRAKKYGHLSGELAMMKEILRGGPITCGVACSNEFTYEYKAGILEDKTGFMDIDHDVEVVGWGEEDGVKYWHVRNSWGTYWGMNGFFKIVRGKNNLGIEADCAFVEPDISDEELVWEEKPIYGGSIFGIVPFDDSAAAHPVLDTSDVTTKDAIDADAIPVAHALPEQVKPAVESQEEELDGFFAVHAFSFFVAGGIFSLAAIFMLARAQGRRMVYRSIP